MLRREASTNLVLELSIIMLVLLGWQITLAEFVGAPIMVVLLVFLFRTFLGRNLLERAKEQAEKGVAGRMEGHAEMDMSVTEGEPIFANANPSCTRRCNSRPRSGGITAWDPRKDFSQCMQQPTTPSAINRYLPHTRYMPSARELVTGPTWNKISAPSLCESLHQAHIGPPAFIFGVIRNPQDAIAGRRVSHQLPL